MAGSELGMAFPQAGETAVNPEYFPHSDLTFLSYKYVCACAERMKIDSSPGETFAPRGGRGEQNILNGTNLLFSFLSQCLQQENKHSPPLHYALPTSLPPPASPGTSQQRLQFPSTTQNPPILPSSLPLAYSQSTLQSSLCPRQIPARTIPHQPLSQQSTLGFSFAPCSQSWCRVVNKAHGAE